MSQIFEIDKQLQKDALYMSRCLQLAACGIYGARPNPMVGAVIVAPGGRIIGEGYHAKQDAALRRPHNKERCA